VKAPPDKPLAALPPPEEIERLAGEIDTATIKDCRCIACTQSRRVPPILRTLAALQRADVGDDGVASYACLLISNGPRADRSGRSVELARAYLGARLRCAALKAENARWRDEDDQRESRCLAERDAFIVKEGLWDKFVKGLKP